MSIAMAQQRGNIIYVYDEKNYQLFATNGELYGYTSSTVTVKKGNMLYTFNEKGWQIGAIGC